MGRRGRAGAALGPAAGGILTQVLGWESIFLVQVPLALVTLVAVRGVRPTSLPRLAGRPHLTANAALLLCPEGWWQLSSCSSSSRRGLGPPPRRRRHRDAGRDRGRPGSHHAPSGLGVRTATGIVLVAGGLGALAVLPRAGWAWTIPPQLLVGAGLGLALAALTERAVAGRAGQVVHGGWTLAARHAGVVLGPPARARADGRARGEPGRGDRAGAAKVLDSRIEPLDKLRLAQNVLDAVDEAEETGDLPDVASVFEGLPSSDEYVALLGALEDQLDRAVTNAFSVPFLLAAALALAALVPVALGRGEPL